MELIQTIQTLQELPAELKRRVAEIAEECAKCQALWVQTGKHQRDDVAAGILTRLLPAVSSLSQYTHRLDQQIRDWSSEHCGV